MTEIITPIKRMTLVSACTKGQLPEDVTATYADIAFAYTDEQIEELYDRLYNKPVEAPTCSEVDSGNSAVAEKLLKEFKAGHMTEDKATFATQLVPSVEHHFRPVYSSRDYFNTGEDFEDIRYIVDCIYKINSSRKYRSFDKPFFNLPVIKASGAKAFELPAGVKGSKMLLGVLNRFLEACGLPPRSSVNETVPMSDYAPLSVTVNIPGPYGTGEIYTDAASRGLHIYGADINYHETVKSSKQIAKSKLLKQSLQNRELTLVMPKTCVNASEFVRHNTKTTLGCPINLEFVAINIIGMPGDSLIIPMITMDILEPECHEGVLQHDGNLVYTRTGKPLEDELRRIHKQNGLPFKSLKDYAANNKYFSWWGDKFQPGILPDEDGNLILVNKCDQHYSRPYPSDEQVYMLDTFMKILSSDQGLHSVDLRTYRKVTFALTYAEYLVIAPIVKAIHLEYFEGKRSTTVTRIDAMDAIRNFYVEHKEDIDAVERALEQNIRLRPMLYDVPGLSAMLPEMNKGE